MHGGYQACTTQSRSLGAGGREVVRCGTGPRSTCEKWSKTMSKSPHVLHNHDRVPGVNVGCIVTQCCVGARDNGLQTRRGYTVGLQAPSRTDQHQIRTGTKYSLPHGTFNVWGGTELRRKKDIGPKWTKMDQIGPN